MMKKNTIAAMLAALTMTGAAVAWAADEPTTATQAVAPVAVEAPAATAPAKLNAQPKFEAPSVAMSAAVATAEKEYGATARSANLKMTKNYGLVWDVRLMREDKTMIRALVDAKTGKIAAADMKGIREGRGMKKPCHHKHGATPAKPMNPDCPMAKTQSMNPDCPMAKGGTPDMTPPCPMGNGMAPHHGMHGRM